MNSAKMPRRRKPLLTCAVSFSAVASKAYSRARNFDGPVGSILKKMTKLASMMFPFFHVFKSHFIEILSFTDDRLVSLEKTIETLFPPSTKLFDKIDIYIRSAEILPAKFDDAVDKFPMMIHQVPFLDWALVHAISWLKFFISILTLFGSSDSREKEIMVDTGSRNEIREIELESERPIFAISDHSGNPSHSSVSSNYGTQNPVYDSSEDKNESISTPSFGSSEHEAKMLNPRVVMKSSYKEILEKGTEERIEHDENGTKRHNAEHIAINSKGEGDKTGNRDRSRQGNGDEDPILQLFEEGWHMKPTKGGRQDSLPCSASCS